MAYLYVNPRQRRRSIGVQDEIIREELEGFQQWSGNVAGLEDDSKGKVGIFSFQIVPIISAVLVVGIHVNHF